MMLLYPYPLMVVLPSDTPPVVERDRGKTAKIRIRITIIDEESRYLQQLFEKIRPRTLQVEAHFMHTTMLTHNPTKRQTQYVPIYTYHILYIYRYTWPQQ